MGGIFNAIFGGGGSSAPAYKAPEVSARDLVASTSAADPNAATMGSDSKKQKDKRGKSALMVKARKTPTPNSNGTGLNI